MTKKKGQETGKTCNDGDYVDDGYDDKSLNISISPECIVSKIYGGLREKR